MKWQFIVDRLTLLHLQAHCACTNSLHAHSSDVQDTRCASLLDSGLALMDTVAIQAQGS